MAREVLARHAIHKSSFERSRRYVLLIAALWLGLAYMPCLRAYRARFWFVLCCLRTGS